MKLFLFLPIAVLLTAAVANAQTVTPTPTALNFTWQTGSTLPAAQKITLKIAPTSTPSYSVSTPPSDQWLIATPTTSETIATPVSVRVNPNTLGPGVYNSTVTISVSGVSSPITIAVTLTVTLPPGGAVVSPSAITLSYPGTLTGSFTIVGSSSALTFTAASTTSWLTISPNAGAILPSSSQTITVTADPTSLAPQAAAYTGSISVTISNGGSSKEAVSVQLTVNSQTPAVSSFWPQQIPVGAPDTPVTIRGANFYSQTSVSAAGYGTPLKVTVISSDALLATVPTALLASAGSVTLTVTNPAPGGAGPPFSIAVGNTPVIQAICNAASYATGAVSPGEIIAIFGQNLGPTTPILETVANGFVQGNVGVDVQIGGVDAPILYASNQQVTVQVPYATPLGTQAMGTGQSVVLTYGSNSAVAATDVVTNAPGLFTANASGVGQALVLDFNSTTNAYTVNSATTAAHIGDTITFFVTGEGDYANGTYSPETGFIVPIAGSYPELSPLPVVMIGGVAATTVSYAGPIPTDMMGLLQINAVIPVGATTGKAVPLLVYIGSFQTQGNVTMNVSQ